MHYPGPSRKILAQQNSAPAPGFTGKGRGTGADPAPPTDRTATGFSRHPQRPASGLVKGKPSSFDLGTLNGAPLLGSHRGRVTDGRERPTRTQHADLSRGPGQGGQRPGRRARRTRVGVPGQRLALCGPDGPGSASLTGKGETEGRAVPERRPPRARGSAASSGERRPRSTAAAPRPGPARGAPPAVLAASRRPRSFRVLGSAQRPRAGRER